MDQSVWTDKNGDEQYIPALEALYDEIVKEDTTKATAAPTVKLDGVKLTWTQSGNAYTAIIDYADWKDLTSADSYIVTPAAGNEIAISGQTSFTTKDLKVAVDTSTGSQKIEILSEGDKSGEVTATYTYTITYDVDKTGTDLLKDGTKVASKLSAYNSKPTTIANLLGYTYTDADGVDVKVPGYYSHNGADWDWTFYDPYGKRIEASDNVSTAALGYATVTVNAMTANKSATYVVVFDNDVVSKALVAIVKTMVEDCEMSLADVANVLVSSYSIGM